MTQALQDLTSTDDAKVKKALKHAREKGDKRFILPLLTAFAARAEDGLREEMQDLLGSLKISAAEGVFLDALGDEAFQHVAADVLAFLWSFPSLNNIFHQVLADLQGSSLSVQQSRHLHPDHCFRLFHWCLFEGEQKILNHLPLSCGFYLPSLEF